MKQSLFLCLLMMAGYSTLTAKNHLPAAVSDSIAPTIVCPASFTVNLLPAACDTVIAYSVTATDDAGAPIVIQLSGLPSGANFATGASVQQYLATDLAGNTASCSFTINVLEHSTLLNCKTGLVVIPLSANECTATISVFDLLNGLEIGCLDNFEVKLDKTPPLGTGPWVDAIVGPADAAKTYMARVRDITVGNSCIVSVSIRDLSPPNILMPDTIRVACLVPVEPDYLADTLGIAGGRPVVVDACDGEDVTLTYIDSWRDLTCTELPGVVEYIERKWRARDQSANTREKTQIILMELVAPLFQAPPNTTTSCASPDFSEETNGRPFIELYNHRFDADLACDWFVGADDTLVQAGCSGQKNLLRRWFFWNPCEGLSDNNPIIIPQLIEVVDQIKPTIECPGDLLVEVSDLDCRTTIDLPEVTLFDNCSGILSIQAFYADSGLTKVLSGNIVYQTDSTGAVIRGAFDAVLDFPVGSTQVLYVVTDSCNNVSECTFTVTLADPQPPTAVCDTLMAVQLPPDGYLSLPASIFDNGSTDACVMPNFKARWVAATVCDSSGIAWSDTLQVCCRSYGDTLIGMLRVYDIAVPTGTPLTDFGEGHFSDCQFRVVVAGAGPPVCTPPADVTVSCADFQPDLTPYGAPIALNCWIDSVAVSLDYSEFDSACVRGTITRNYQVFDPNGPTGTCAQKIVVSYSEDYYVRFPDDVLKNNCSASDDFGAPIIFNIACEKVQVSFTDQYIYGTADACLLIERTWTVINACTFDSTQLLIQVLNPNPDTSFAHPDNLTGPVVSPIQTPGDPWAATSLELNPTDPIPTNFAIYYIPSGNGYQYVQRIQVFDDQLPEVLNCPQTGEITVLDSTMNDPQLWKASYWFDPVHELTDLCETPSLLSITATDSCSGANLEIDYQLMLDLNQDGVLETAVHSQQLPPTNTVFYNNLLAQGEARAFDFRGMSIDGQWRFVKEEEVSGGQKTVRVRWNTNNEPNNYQSPQLPHGKHRIKWTIKDGCGNEMICEYDILVKDGVGPDIMCVPVLTRNLPLSSQLLVFVSDFVDQVNDNCTPDPYPTLAIRRSGTGTGYPTDASGNPTKQLYFDCLDLGLNEVEIWCHDKAGNFGVCTSKIQINDVSSVCESNSSFISGTVTTEAGDGLEGVHVNVAGAEAFGPPFSFLPISITTGFGNYSSMGDLPPFSNFTITPKLNSQPLNGLTTFDLVLISKHILGIEPLGTPLKMVAADANKSNTITTFDVVEFRKLILGIYDSLPANDSWRFIPKSHEFDTLGNPLGSPFPEKITIADFDDHETGLDFWAVKVGDVNNTVELNANITAEGRNRPLQYFDISTNSTENMRSGDVVELQIQSAEALQGCQFTLNLDGLELVELAPGAGMSLDHFASFPAQNAVTVAWEQGGVADFSLKCRAQRSGHLREMVSIGSRITRAEAYPASNAGISNPVLRFPALGVFELYQNQPNPFSDETEIRFNLPEAGEVSLKIHDANGKLVFEQTGFYESGVQSIRIDKSDLDVSGVLYYRMETGQYSASRKMVRVW